MKLRRLNDRYVIWTKKAEALLGTDTDARLAETFGIHQSQVTSRRQQLHIPAFGVLQWTPEVVALLGVMTDTEVAERIGRSQALVTRKRNLLGIKARGKQ